MASEGMKGSQGIRGSTRYRMPDTEYQVRPPPSYSCRKSSNQRTKHSTNVLDLCDEQFGSLVLDHPDVPRDFDVMFGFCG